MGKSLRFSIYSVMEALNNPIVREFGVRINPTLEQLRTSSRSIISKQESMRQAFYDRNNVPIINGQAKFLDPHTILVDDELKLTADHVIIHADSRATNSD